MSSHVFFSLCPNAGATAPLYTVPESKRFTGRVIITNKGTDTTIRIQVSPNGASLNANHTVMSDEILETKRSIATAPLMLPSGAVVRVLSVSGEVNFHITGLLQDS